MQLNFKANSNSFPDSIWKYYILNHYHFLSKLTLLISIRCCVFSRSSSLWGVVIRRSQLSPDKLWQPLIEADILAVNLPVFLLLDVARPPLVVGQKGILEIVTELSLFDCGHHFTDETVRLGLRVSAHWQQDVGGHQQNAWTQNIYWCSIVFGFCPINNATD